MADENTIKKIPPHDNNAEKSVIGAMMLDRDAISEVTAVITKEDFYNTQYGLLFDAMYELYNEGKPVDEIVLGEKLREKGAPEEICALGFLGDILSSVQTSAFAKNHAQIVKDKSYLRKLIKLSDNLMANSYNGSEPVEDIMSKAESDIFKLMQNRSGSKDFTPINKIVVNVVEDIEAATRNRGRINGLRTGFTDLDNMLTGLHGGELILVAARPSMGKTAFVLNIAHHVAVKDHIPVVLFSLEMGKEQLVSRLVAVDSMVEAKSLKTGDISDGDWAKIISTVDNMSAAPMFIDDNSSISIAELRTKCRKLKQTDGIGLIIIDYLQLMSAPGKVESRQLFIAEVSRALKSLARELNVPVIALSQLNRAVDSRPDHRPVLADLRESGAIEQDADVVMFIYRDEYYTKEESEKPGIAEIIIAKQRNGATGPIDLAWIGKYTKFANLSRENRGINKADENAANANANNAANA